MEPEGSFPDLVPLETERLVLRKLTLTDAADIYHYASDPLVARYVTFHPHETIDTSRAYLQRVIDAYSSRYAAPWGMELKENHTIIGTCGFCSWDSYHRRAEIAYAIGRPYWGNRYTAEAVRALISFGFSPHGLHRIQATCLVANSASARVMEKAGMHYEGTLRQYMFLKGASQDLKMYAITRDTWLSDDLPQDDDRVEAGPRST